MVVNRHGENLLGMLLPDHVLVQAVEKLLRLWHGELGGRFLLLLVQLFFEDTATDVDAPVTNVNAGTGDQLFDFGVALSAEGAHREIGGSGHGEEGKGRGKETEDPTCPISRF